MALSQSILSHIEWMASHFCSRVEELLVRVFAADRIAVHIGWGVALSVFFFSASDMRWSASWICRSVMALAAAYSSKDSAPARYASRRRSIRFCIPALRCCKRDSSSAAFELVCLILKLNGSEAVASARSLARIDSFRVSPEICRRHSRRWSSWAFSARATRSR